MLTLDQVKEKLKDRRIPMVSRATGLSISTLHSIRDGKADDCRVSTLIALTKYFEEAGK